ncbi:MULTISPECIES: hypothetical protein [unclassified Clostridium]|uniref:Uncharacterized protein n=1 Tax=Clostridium sulfidigenes TaxID=318464 RepID=A0A927ZKP5_9CLOT|nr:hypothetical protein [Clostridium sulfidigenes]
MKNVLIFLGSILLFSIIVLGIYALLKKFVFDKIKINKWLVLIMAFIVFVVPPLVFTTLPVLVTNYVIPGIFVILFLWFWDLCGFMSKTQNKIAKAAYNKPKSKKNDIVIKPKAKPNRVKNNPNNK